MHLLILALLLTYYLFVKEGLRLQNYKNIKPHQVLIIVTILVILYSEYKHENLLKQFESFNVKKLPKLNVNVITSENFMLYDKKAFVNTKLRIIDNEHTMMINLKDIPNGFSTHMYYVNDDKKKSKVMAIYPNGSTSSPITLKNNSWYKLEFNNTTSPIRVRYVANPTNNIVKKSVNIIDSKNHADHVNNLFYDSNSSIQITAPSNGKIHTNIYYNGSANGLIKTTNASMMLYAVPLITGKKNTPRIVNIETGKTYQITYEPFTCKLEK